MSVLTHEQIVGIEAVAAQLHDRDERRCKTQIFWPMVDEQVKKRYRDIARRKLKTGEIDGWFKLQPEAIQPSGKPSRAQFVRNMIQAAE